MGQESSNTLKILKNKEREYQKEVLSEKQKAFVETLEVPKWLASAKRYLREEK